MLITSFIFFELLTNKCCHAKQEKPKLEALLIRLALFCFAFVSTFKTD